jgi:hypothetical protein
MGRAYTLTIDDSTVLRVAEMIAIMFVNVSKPSFWYQKPGVCTAAAIQAYKDQLAYDLVALCREPLKDRRFRAEFTGYLSTHPIDSVRNDAWPWMEEVLTFEE